MNELIESKQFAKYLGISIRTLDTLDKNGDLPTSFRIGHLRRWRMVDVEQWISEKLEQRVTQIVAAGVAVKAEAHSDDHVFEIKFDATKWFEQASDDQIRELAQFDWGGCYAADEIAQFCKDRNETLVDMFGYLARIAGTRKACGFECTIDHASVEELLKKIRPHLVAEFKARGIL